MAKITIQRERKISRLRMPQPLERSATDKNLRATANTIKPSATFTELSQLPDLGRVFNQEGKMAKRVNGIANANANPNMPMAGARRFPCVAASTSNHPMMGPVHEKETKARVKAMKKRLIKPVVLSTLLSILLVHEAGRTISNAPMKEKAKTMSSAKNMRLNTGLVAMLLSALAPKIAVMISPSVT